MALFDLQQKAHASESFPRGHREGLISGWLLCPARGGALNAVIVWRRKF